MSDAFVELQRQINALRSEVERLKRVEKPAKFFGGIDLTPAAQTFTLANNATVQPFVSDNNFSGLLLLSETSNTGSVGLIACGGATVNVAGASIPGVYSGSAGNAGTINVYYTASPNYVLTIENKTGANRTIIVAPIRVRTSA